MNDTKAEVKDFLEKCELLRKSKFIMATTRIKDILKSIVNSKTLYELFHAVTEKFDYITAKRRYLQTYQDGFLTKSMLVLPENPAERLAFIFCLLVEFDHDSINFNNFLQRYFAEDGSYFSSFHSFCDTVIGSMEELISDLFREELEDKEENGQNTAEAPSSNFKAAPDPEAAEKLTVISLLIANEKQIIADSAMSDGEKRDGITMLNELEGAIRDSRAGSVEAILRGYEYYSACHNNFSKLINLLNAEALNET